MPPDDAGRVQPPVAPPPVAPPPVTQLPVVRALLPRCRFPPPGTPVTVAVSGGPDSLALLLLARAAGLDAHVVHVDHGLRLDSARDGEVVRAAAAEVGASVTVRRVEVAPGGNLEARARAARYAVLPGGVLVGHTADDQAETVLLNLLRGAGLDGLSAMADRTGPDALDSRSALASGSAVDSAGPERVRRPILGLRRAETAAVCAAAGWVAVRDPTNAEGRFRRNQVRHRLLPLLGEVAGRDPVPVLARTAALVAADAGLLDALAAELDASDARALTAAPVPLARRAVRRWLRAGSDEERHPPSAAEVERVLAVARGVAAGTELSGGRRLRRTAGRLRLEPASGGGGQGGSFTAPGTGSGDLA